MIGPARRSAPASPKEDDAVDLPELDGEAGEAGADLFGDDAAQGLGDDDAVTGLEDEIAAEEAAEAWIEPLADVESEGWETGEDDPLDADPELAVGEAEPWTEGSDEDREEPIELDVTDLGRDARDDGEEGLDDERVEELELPPTPPTSGPEEEGYADDLDVGGALPERRSEDDPPGMGEVE